MDNKTWLELAAATCDHAGIQPGSIEVVRTWENTKNTVYRLGGQRYLKLYHRDAQRQFPVKRAAMQTLENGINGICQWNNSANSVHSVNSV